MINTPRDEGSTPLSIHEQRVLVEMESDLNGLFGESADEYVSRTRQAVALILSIMCLAVATTAIIVGVTDPGQQARALGVAILGVFFASILLALNFKKGARGL